MYTQLLSPLFENAVIVFSVIEVHRVKYFTVNYQLVVLLFLLLLFFVSVLSRLRLPSTGLCIYSYCFEVCSVVRAEKKPIMSSEDAVICVICGEEEKDTRKVIECLYCHKNEHFNCKNVVGSAVRKLRGQPYFCSVPCNELHQRTTCNTQNESKVLKDLQTVLQEVRETRVEMQAVRNTVGEMEKFQSYLSEQLDALLVEVQSLKMDHKALKTNVESLASEQKELSSRVDSLELQLDRANRAAVSKNAVILGMPTKHNEDPVQIVRNVAAAVGAHLPDDAVVDAKRMLPKHSGSADTKVPPIKVCFSNVSHKEELFTKKKNRGQLLSSDVDGAITTPARNIVLRDELTAFGMKLLSEVRGAQEQLGCKYVWPGRNGVILMKHSEKSRINVIRNVGDLKSLQRSGKKRPNSNTTSPDGQAPHSKRR